MPRDPRQEGSAGDAQKTSAAYLLVFGRSGEAWKIKIMKSCGETFAVDLPRRFKKVTVSFTNGKDGHCPIIVTILDPTETDATKQEKGRTRTTPGNDGSVTGEDGKRVTFKCEGKADDGTCHFNFDLLAY